MTLREQGQSLLLGTVIFVFSFLAFTQIYRFAAFPYRDDFNIVGSTDGSPPGRDFLWARSAASAMKAGGKQNIPYPPLGLAGFLPFVALPDNVAYPVFSLLLIAGLYLTLYWSSRESRLLSPGQAALLAAVLLGVLYHTYWFQFELERGNSNVFGGMLAILALFCLSRGRPWTAVAVLVCATHWRIFPAVLAAFLLLRGGVRPLVVYLALTALGFVALGMHNYRAFMEVLQHNFDVWTQFWPNHSLSAYFRERGLQHVAAAKAGLMAWFCILVAIAFAGRFRRDRPTLPVRNEPLTVFETALVGVAFGIMDLVPILSMDYKLSIHVVPFLLLITRLNPAQEARRGVYLGAVAVVAASFGYLSAPGMLLKTPGVLLSTAAYAVLAADSLVKGWRRPATASSLAA